jgi:hypothetical protein
MMLAAIQRVFVMAGWPDSRDKVSPARAASVFLAGKHWDNQSNVQSVVSAQQDPD